MLLLTALPRLAFDDSLLVAVAWCALWFWITRWITRGENR